GAESVSVTGFLSAPQTRDLKGRRRRLRPPHRAERALPDRPSHPETWNAKARAVAAGKNEGRLSAPLVIHPTASCYGQTLLSMAAPGPFLRQVLPPTVLSTQ